MFRRVLLALMWLVGAGAVHADVFRPAYLELRESGIDCYQVMWKVPLLGDSRLGVRVVFPEGTTQLTPPQRAFTGSAYVERWQVARAGGFAGQTLRIEGIERGVSDVIVRLERADGSSQVERLLPQRPQFVVLAASAAIEVAGSYFVLGVRHILGSVDHLLFVLALLLIVRGGRRIFITVTAFTVAHSITLVAATLGWMRIPGPPVEALIALSIVFVAAEAVQELRGKPGLTARAPWVVAFCFGLLHGLGFASALAEAGLPQTAIPVALLTFNLGVEVGQLLFIAAVLAGRAVLLRMRMQLPAWVRALPAYAIGTLAMFWVLERVTVF
jgi:hydrogenase/urease accessory protein HupE